MGIIAGLVSDSTGAPIAGAEVSVVGSTGSVRTDEHGHFRMTAPLGLVTLSARRMGFEPGTKQLQLAGSSDAMLAAIQLRALPTQLKPVVVRTDRIEYKGRLAGYYQRLESQNGGYFISRDQIDRENPRMLSQLLTHVPGVNATRMRAGGGGVRMRGRNCWPLVWLDGLQMGAGEVDLDAFPPSTIHGIELYLGSTTAPMRYLGTRDMSSCGTILLWSRGPDTDPPVKPGPPRYDIEKLVASLKVYTPDQVDKPVAADPQHAVSVEYPAPLFASGVGGSVIAEFVVDTDGKVQDGTFGIVSSTDPLLSDAVRRAVEVATFRPAMLRGSPVKQVVQQPFSFPPREKKSPRG
jgi:TonB family protein